MENVAKLKKHVANLLQAKKISTPALIMGLDLIDKQYELLKRTLPRVDIYFSVKANPDATVLTHLRHLGSGFEAASYGEIQQCMAVGSTAAQIHFGNSIKKREHIRKAFANGVETFSVDSEQEVRKVAQMAPGAKVLVRLATDGKGAVWGLTKKFGTSTAHAIELMRLANDLNLKPHGISFHVGSQQSNHEAWSVALKNCEIVIAALKRDKIKLRLINLGGGLPAEGYMDGHLSTEIDTENYLLMIQKHLDVFERNCGEQFEFMLEPGRFMVANTGVVVSEVLLDTTREFNGNQERWIFMDVGKFNGLYEATDISLPVHLLNTSLLHSAETTMPMTLSGPSCDSDDMLVPTDTSVYLPTSIKEGDLLVFSSTGAYSNSYSTQKFNGLNPLDVVCLDAQGEIVREGEMVERKIYEMTG